MSCFTRSVHPALPARPSRLPEGEMPLDSKSPQVLFYATHGEELLDAEGPNPKWGVIEKMRRGGHLHLGRCFSAGGSHSVLKDDDGNKLFSFVVLGGHERHVFWASSEKERDAWVADIQAVVGEQLDQSLSQSRGDDAKDRAGHDHAFWDTSLWELRSFYQAQLEDEKEGCRSSTGLLCSGTRVAYILPGSPADRKVRCVHTNEEFRLGIGDEILEVNNEPVNSESCAAMLRGDDVVGSMFRIKVRKSASASAEPASPIAKASDVTTTHLLSPGQSPSSLNRSSIHSFSPYRWDSKSQLGAGEYEVDLCSAPVLNLMRYDELHRLVKRLEDTYPSDGDVAELLKHTEGVIKALDTYSAYSSSHIKGLEQVFHGEMALAASRECMWLRQVS